MAFTNLLIYPIAGYTAAQRAAAISAELWSISRPPKVRQPQDVSAYLFGWIEHPEQNLAVLRGIDNYIIAVHPENDLNKLMVLMPDLIEPEKTMLASFIKNSNQFPFKAIIPSSATILTNEDMIAGGWFLDTELT